VSGEMFVVDLERHNDGEGGLVGPFTSRVEAETYVAGIASDFMRKYATIRPIEEPS
jgi:hypothetical protein